MEIPLTMWKTGSTDGIQDKQLNRLPDVVASVWRASSAHDLGTLPFPCSFQVPRGPTSPAEQLGTTVAGPLRAWAGQQLNALEYSESYAKQTDVRGMSDVTVFMSL